MSLRRAAVGLAVVTLLYLAALVWADSRNHVYSALPALLASLPTLAALSLVSYAIRYARWWWLLARAGHRTRVGDGFLAYLAGFAFTATPGKVGELMRIRYLQPAGVPAHRVVAAFVYERAFDLAVVLVLASLAFGHGGRSAGVFSLVAAFVVAFVAILVVLASHPSWFDVVSTRLGLARHPRIDRVVVTLRDGLATSATWATPVDIAIALAAGIAAWVITAAAFVWLLDRLGLAIATSTAFGIYPLAMLAGAASMLPGGIGSTETAIVALLAVDGAPVATATLAAVGIRLASLWFAILCGFAAAAMLELRMAGVLRGGGPTGVRYHPPGVAPSARPISPPGKTTNHS